VATIHQIFVLLLTMHLLIAKREKNSNIESGDVAAICNQEVVFYSNQLNEFLLIR